MLLAHRAGVKFADFLSEEMLEGFAGGGFVAAGERRRERG
jgi:hypothetical protein